ncbi:MAG TPA: alpha/beta hydrolase [Polyangiaceae bacterium]|nr:alpha/beta hydrolase [Polyangiaceae bacterium]
MKRMSALRKTLALALAASACGHGVSGTAASVPAGASPPSASRALVEARVAAGDGVSIHYVVEGVGPVVVLSHCVDCNLHYWDFVAADLATDHRVVRLDLAGHGDSGADRKAWTIENFAGDIRAVADALALEKFTLVGHSMSGTVVLEAAVELGDRVTGVVPVDSVLDVDARMPAEARKKVIGDLRADYPKFIDVHFPELLPEHPDPKVVERVRHDALSADPERTATILDALFAYREDLALDRLTVPIVAIDSDLRRLELEHNRAHAPQFDARILPGTSHWLMLDEPAAFAALLREVLGEIESGTAKKRPEGTARRSGAPRN